MHKMHFQVTCTCSPSAKEWVDIMEERGGRKVDKWVVSVVGGICGQRGGVCVYSTFPFSSSTSSERDLAFMHCSNSTTWSLPSDCLANRSDSRITSSKFLLPSKYVSIERERTTIREKEWEKGYFPCSIKAIAEVTATHEAMHLGSACVTLHISIVFCTTFGKSTYKKWAFVPLSSHHLPFPLPLPLSLSDTMKKGDTENTRPHHRPVRSHTFARRFPHRARGQSRWRQEGLMLDHLTINGWIKTEGEERRGKGGRTEERGGTCFTVQPSPAPDVSPSSGYPCWAQYTNRWAKSFTST